MQADEMMIGPLRNEYWRPIQVVSALPLRDTQGPDSAEIIRYGRVRSPFGAADLAWSGQGICALTFGAEVDPESLAVQCGHGSAVRMRADQHAAAELGKAIFDSQRGSAPVRIDLRGTAFQLRVWDQLLRIPAGMVSSYGQLAAAIGQPAAARAVGSAVAKNRIGWLVPCHRVIRQDGRIGGYRWGQARKKKMLSWESGALSDRTAGALPEGANSSLAG